MLGRVFLPALAHRTFPLTKITAHASNTGWQTTTTDQTLLWDAAADAFRSQETVLDSVGT